ncbi:hypothetical protein PPYR_03092 [Photinus pyralis]|uniref:CRAL-TRIO domain-containing protein n=1 Tax=Photinus pyralis TaxID=7054 RepID=A0A5N4A1U3_PHOPY|nr:alpha-tocopherol transfer protein-like [Photinus pyralis]XP_031331095.1 alpha-tocopherol transfer protein-like [Photinus pyralis]KAB0791292.1 hypothetical protein PPYR_03092 [Photinus pyralis]
MPLNYASVDFEYTRRASQLKREDVQCLREWLAKQPHLPEILEMEMIFFLLSCDCSIEMTKATIDSHYTLLALSPEIYGARDSRTWDGILNTHVLVPLPTLTPEGYQVVYSGLNDRDPTKYVYADFIKLICTVSKLSLIQKGTVNGLICICDMERYSISHVARIPITVLKKFLAFVQEGLPLQLKAFHLINAGSKMDAILAIVKQCVKHEIFKLIHVHSDYTKTLYDHVPKECLTVELGGTNGSMRDLYGEVKAMVLENMDFVMEDEKKVADESKRLQKSNKFDSLFGIEGTFKRLEID